MKFPLVTFSDPDPNPTRKHFRSFNKALSLSKNMSSLAEQAQETLDLPDPTLNLDQEDDPEEDEPKPEDATPPFAVIRRRIQKMQWVLLTVLGVAGILLPEIRGYLVDRSWSGIFLIFLMELAFWAGLTFVLGWNNRLPDNYVWFAIMRVFLCLQFPVLKWAQSEAITLRRKTWSLPGPLFQLDYFRFWVHHSVQSWGIGWGEVEVTDGSSKVVDVDVTDLITRLDPDNFFTLPEEFGLAFAGAGMLFVMLFMIEFHKLRIDKLGNLILSASFFSTSLASLILVSSLTLDRFGSEFHLILCKIWVPYALFTVWMLAFYLLKRLFCSAKESWKKRRFVQVDCPWFAIEIVMCILQTAIVLHYIRAVHKDFEDSSSTEEIPYRKSRSFPCMTRRGWMDDPELTAIMADYYGFINCEEICQWMDWVREVKIGMKNWKNAFFYNTN